MATGPQRHVGDATYHVGDAYVWSAIHYLDSPTSYREYLPASGRTSSMLVLLALGLVVLIVVAGLAPLLISSAG